MNMEQYETSNQYNTWSLNEIGNCNEVLQYIDEINSKDNMQCMHKTLE